MHSGAVGLSLRKWDGAGRPGKPGDGFFSLDPIHNGFILLLTYGGQSGFRGNQDTRKKAVGRFLRLDGGMNGWKNGASR